MEFSLRFSPTVLATMCCLLLWPKFGNGPFFHSDNIDFITEPCYQNWWLSFTYLANWYPSDQVVNIDFFNNITSLIEIIILFQCNVMHWYLSADFQLHLILFFVIILFSTRPFIAILYVISMIMLGIIIPIIIVIYGFADAPNPSIFLHPDQP